MEEGCRDTLYKGGFPCVEWLSFGIAWEGLLELFSVWISGKKHTFFHPVIKQEPPLKSRPMALCRHTSSPVCFDTEP